MHGYTIRVLLTYHSGSSGERCLRAAVEVVDGVRAHEGQLHVGVSVDTARHDQPPLGLDGPRAPGDDQVSAKLSDRERVIEIDT